MNYSATERSLFLGDLSVYCTEQDIFEIFQSFGPIESIQLKRKSVANGRPSYGFVQFRFRESAEEALRVMNGRVIHGRAIRLGWAEPPKVEVKIGVKKPDIAPRPAAAPAPVNALPSDLSFLTNSLASLGLGGPRNSSSNTHILPGVHGNTEIVIPPLDGKPIQSAKGVIDTAQVHFSYVTNKVEPLKEEVFRTVFQHFGPVLDVAIKKSQYHPDKGVQTGYGFIHYPLTEEGIACALESVRSLHELVLDNVKYSCRVSHALEEFLKMRQTNNTQRERRSSGFSSFFSSSFNPFSSFTSSSSSSHAHSNLSAPTGPRLGGGLDLDRGFTYDSYGFPVDLPPPPTSSLAPAPAPKKHSFF